MAEGAAFYAVSGEGAGSKSDAREAGFASRFQVVAALADISCGGSDADVGACVDRLASGANGAFARVAGLDATFSRGRSDAQQAFLAGCAIAAGGEQHLTVFGLTEIVFAGLSLRAIGIVFAGAEEWIGRHAEVPKLALGKAVKILGTQEAIVAYGSTKFRTCNALDAFV